MQLYVFIDKLKMTREDIILSAARGAKSLFPSSYRIYVNYPVVYKYKEKPLHDCIEDIANEFYVNDPLRQLNINYDDNSSDSYTDYIYYKLGSKQYGINNEWVPSATTLDSYGIEYIAVADIAIANENKIIEYMFIEFNKGMKMDTGLIHKIAYSRYHTIKISTPTVASYHVYKCKHKDDPNIERKLYANMSSKNHNNQPYTMD
jgi:hypothetical protein